MLMLHAPHRVVRGIDDAMDAQRACANGRATAVLTLKDLLLARDADFRLRFALEDTALPQAGVDSLLDARRVRGCIGAGGASESRVATSAPTQFQRPGP